MRGSKGYYTGTRSLLRKPTRAKGKPHIGKILEDYTPGSQVIIKMDSSTQKSMPHKRFHGKIESLWKNGVADTSSAFHKATL